MTKTGKSLAHLAALAASASALCAPSSALAAAITFTARVDRTQISVDETVSLKFTVQSEGGASVSEPRYRAPDFDLVNQYTGTYAESYYDGTTGQFGMRNNQQITLVLKPSKAGAHRISGLTITASGKSYTAPDITVQVVGSGAGTPPPQRYGGSGIGLRGASKRVTGPSVKLRAEVDKTHAYKGEQIVVSYYLYRRVRVFNIQVEKFPVLKGFLREDLEMPVMTNRLDTERVMLDGAMYERSLLMRYAAYPLQDGKLSIDSASLKYAYYAANNSLDEEDPFMGFFRQMTPQQGIDRSEQLSIEVSPLPEDGKPNSFTGGVGDFTVTSAIDKYEVKANEAVTLKLNIEGRGNLAAIGEPIAKWPDGVELYDSKGVAKSGAGGVGQKTFEYLLIPRTPGKVELPGIEFSYFDPTRKQYVSRKTEPVTITVTDPAPGTTPYVRGKSGASQAASGADADTKPTVAPKGLKGPPSVADLASPGIPAWRWLYWLCTAAFASLVGLVGFDLMRKTQAKSQAQAASKAKAHSRSWARLHENARAANDGAPWQEVVQSYELLAGVVFDAIDRAYAVGARSRPRSQLKVILVDEKGLTVETWDRVSRLLEYAEIVRFATSAGAISEQAARKDLARWVAEGESVARILETKS